VLSYSEKLRDPRWQRRRLEKLQQQQFSCEECSDTRSTLHVHPRVYERGRDPWEYELDDLQVLCENCHESKHDQLAILNRVLSRAAGWQIEILICIVAGYLIAQEGDESERRKIVEQIPGLTDFGLETLKAGHIAARICDRIDRLWRKRREQ
jgi:hypothetical protein